MKKIILVAASFAATALMNAAHASPSQPGATPVALSSAGTATLDPGCRSPGPNAAKSQLIAPDHTSTPRAGASPGTDSAPLKVGWQASHQEKNLKNS